MFAVRCVRAFVCACVPPAVFRRDVGHRRVRLRANKTHQIPQPRRVRCPAKPSVEHPLDSNNCVRISATITAQVKSVNERK
jgi:hypothetical protein